MEEENTHIIFDGKRVVVSPNLQQVFSFLCGIDEELDSIFGFDKKLESIKKQHLETIELIQVLSKKLKENSIEFNFTLSEHPKTIADKLRMYHPIRSKFIILFANLEVLLCLNIAYKNKISDKKSIISKTMNNNTVQLFLDEFCLNKENEWVKKNPERSKNITADDLRKLRNALTHFFSIDGGLQIADAGLDEKSRKLEQSLNSKVKFISPEDLYEITKGAYALLLKKWNDDCINNPNEFKERVYFVNDIVKNNGVILMAEDKIDILISEMDNKK